jgi:hypothetical protein
MEGLLLLAAEILIIGIAAWVVATEVKTPEEIRRMLEPPPKVRKARFPELVDVPVKAARRH